MRHATDPDHVIAVSTIVSEHRSARDAALVGAVWGLGHGVTILALGSGVILLGWVIPVRLGLAVEFAAGIMLIWLGLSTLWRVLDHPHHVHAHEHQHGEVVHSHPHSAAVSGHDHAHDPVAVTWLDRRLAGIRVYQLLRPLMVGLVHGVAGSAAVVLLALTTLGGQRAGMLYLLLFAVGTIVGMTAVAVGMSLPFTIGERRSGGWTRGLRLVAGALSVAFGGFLAWRVGVTEGLFASWTA
jgi:high-affinity nickel-transport protein